MDISPTSGIAQAVFMPSTPPANQQARPAALASAASVDDAVLQRALDTVNLQMQAIPSNIQFSLDKDNGKIIVKVVDSQTNTVLLQIPSEEMLGISKSLDKLQGLLIRVKA
jgi:flagellar protein FlaG